MSQADCSGCDCGCPPVGLVNVVGTKWGACVVSLLGHRGPVRFSPIQHCLSGVNPTTVSSTLRALQHADLVRRAAAPGPDGRPVPIYSLTPRGRTLFEQLLPLARSGS